MLNNNDKLIFAGPCGVENKEQIFEIASKLKSLGINHLRAGAYKGQNYPFINGKSEYLGMGDEGVKLLAQVQDKFDMKVACDMQSLRQAQVLKEYNIAYPQIGARNCDSLEFLREVRKLFKDTDKTIILKRGTSTTIQELLGYAQHLGGSDRVILCERGVVHFDRSQDMRWRLDMVGVALLKFYHQEYKIIVDPSHGSGDRNIVPLLSKCALAISDGLMIEVHINPDASPTDAKQTMHLEDFSQLMKEIKNYG